MSGIWCDHQRRWFKENRRGHCEYLSWWIWCNWYFYAEWLYIWRVPGTKWAGCRWDASGDQKIYFYDQRRSELPGLRWTERTGRICQDWEKEALSGSSCGSYLYAGWWNCQCGSESSWREKPDGWYVCKGWSEIWRRYFRFLRTLQRTEGHQDRYWWYHWACAGSRKRIWFKPHQYRIEWPGR